MNEEELVRLIRLIHSENDIKMAAVIIAERTSNKVHRHQLAFFAIGVAFALIAYTIIEGI